jgi:BirA family transcriptional regulator, biotin operon repressor / biotin---[acetyl-CoA-carboxylase] ligase
MSFGVPHHHFERTDSTNTRARELAAEGAEHGTVVTADEQTAGRGRQGRTWTAPPGKALLYSAIVRPLDERHLMLPLAVPLAVCAAAEELAADPSAESREKAKPATAAAKPKPLRCKVKWPNDVLVDGRKVAGVLVEGRPQEGWAVLGIGVNVAVDVADLPDDLHATAGTLGRPRADREPFLHALLAALEARLREPPAGTVGALRARDALAGRRVRWTGGEGVAGGIDDAGRLVVGDERLDAGEVHLA